MLLDALRWNMLNIIRVELFFNVYELYDVFINSSFKTLQGQYVVASFVITLLAQTFVQFDWSWLLSFYALYLSVGICCWIYRRVFFYRRKLDWAGVQRRINQFETDRIQAANGGVGSGHSHHLNGDGATTGTISTTGTLKHGSSKSNHHNGPTSSASSSSSSSSSSEEHTNSLQRLRSSSYHNFLKTPRQNHREFALSLSHLSHISKLIADHWDKDIYDEMHIQILATRRDVVNIILRCILFLATTFLAYMK